MQIAVLTPADGYFEDWQTPAADYVRLFGGDLSCRSWTDPGDLSAFDLILPLLAWGYQRNQARWFAALDAWEAAGLPFANPVSTLRWNSDKIYLVAMEAAGVAIVPTRVSQALESEDLQAVVAQFGTADLVVKPLVSGGADGTYRLRAGDAIPADVRGKEMLIQPMMPDIASEGEYSLFHFDGRFSHAILKRPSAGDFRVQEQFGGREEAVAPPPEALALAEAALAAAPEPPLYARIDMVRDGAVFRLMELELIEPSLFFKFAPDGGALFAAAVRARG